MRSGPARPRLALLHRARSQWAIVAAAGAVVLLVAALAAFAAALAGPGFEHALSASVASLDADGTGRDVTSVTSISDELDPDAEPVPANQAVDTVTTALLDAAGDYDADISVWVGGPMTHLDAEVPHLGYLLDADTAAAHANLRAGRWPTHANGVPLEVAVPQVVADELGLDVGDTVQLETTPATELIVVGIFDPITGDEWLREPLRGAGISSVTNGVREVGPFLTAPGELATTSSPMGRLSVTMDPLLAADPSGIPHLAAATAGLRKALGDELGDGVRWVVVRSQLGAVYAQLRSQLQLATSLAVAVLVVVIAVALAAVALIAQLVARRRAAESALLRDRGASPAQLARRSTAEAGTIAVIAAVLGAPLAWMGYLAVASSSAFGAAWELGPAADPSSIPGSVWVAALVAAATGAAVLVVAALRRRTLAGDRSRAGTLARSGADLALAAVAVFGVVQLRTHTPGAGRVDPVLVLVPALCVLATAALVSRLLPAVARTAEGVPRRSLGVASALAGWHVARGGALRGTFLAVVAASTATLATVVLATYSLSQGDQADAQVGADVVVAEAQPAGGGAALAESAGGPLTPVTDHAVVLGTRPDGVSLFAIASDVAGSTVTGRPQGVESWDAAVASLNAPTDNASITVDGPSITLDIAGTASSPGTIGPLPVTLFAEPTVVVEDAWGTTYLLSGEQVELDGNPHTVTAQLPVGTVAPQSLWTVRAIQFTIYQIETGDIFSWSSDRIAGDMTVTVRGAEGRATTWDGSGEYETAQFMVTKVSATGSTIGARFSYWLYGIGALGSTMTLVPFPVSDEVPVLVTADLAKEMGLANGDSIALSTDYATITAQVAGTVGYVPGHVNEAALWADRTGLQRALLSVGSATDLTDAWWGSGLPDAAAESLRNDDFVPVTSREERATELRDDPSQVPLRLAWVLAIVAAAALAVAGGAAHAATEAQHRGLTLARLRAVGVSRKQALRSHLAQHALAVGGAVLAGIAVGLLLGALLAPSLVVSQSGDRPVPPAALVLPWSPLALVCGGMLALVLAAGIPAARAAVSRSTVAALRAGEVT